MSGLSVEVGIFSAEEPVILQGLVVLDQGGVAIVLQVAVCRTQRVLIAYKGEGGQNVLQGPEEAAVGIGGDTAIREQILGQEVQAGFLGAFQLPGGSWPR